MIFGQFFWSQDIPSQVVGSFLIGHLSWSWGTHWSVYARWCSSQGWDRRLLLEAGRIPKIHENSASILEHHWFVKTSPRWD
jgi:hypothetical protein